MKKFINKQWSTTAFNYFKRLNEDQEELKQRHG